MHEVAATLRNTLIMSVFSDSIFFFLEASLASTCFSRSLVSPQTFIVRASIVGPAVTRGAGPVGTEGLPKSKSDSK